MAKGQRVRVDAFDEIRVCRAVQLPVKFFQQPRVRGRTAFAAAKVAAAGKRLAPKPGRTRHDMHQLYGAAALQGKARLRGQGFQPGQILRLQFPKRLIDYGDLFASPASGSSRLSHCRRSSLFPAIKTAFFRSISVSQTSLDQGMSKT